MSDPIRRLRTEDRGVMTADDAARLWNVVGDSVDTDPEVMANLARFLDGMGVNVERALPALHAALYPEPE